MAGARAPAVRPPADPVAPARTATAATPRPGRASARPTSRRRCPGRASAVAYGELHAHSSFSFLDGASAPEELAEEAVRLGLESLTLTDHDGVYGVVRFAEAAEAHGLATGFGAELSLDVALPSTQAERAIAARVGVPDPPGTHLLALARDPDGYAALSRAIGTAHLRGGAKGRPVYDDLDELAAAGRRPLAGAHRLPQGRGAPRPRPRRGAGGPARRCSASSSASAATTSSSSSPTSSTRSPTSGTRCWPRSPTSCASTSSPPPPRTTTARRAGRWPPRWPRCAPAAASTRSTAGCPAWAGQHLRSGEEMAARFARWPDAVANAARLAKEIAFPLSLIAPDLPPFPCPPGHDEMSYLRELTYARRGRAVRRQAARGQGLRDDRARAGDHRGAALPRLLPRRLGDREVLPRQRDPVPGPGLGGQLRGLLRAADHRRSTPSTTT